MKLAYQQLEQHLKKNLAPIYLINSDETLLLQETVDLLRHTAQQNGFSERTRISVENSDWGDTLCTAAQSLSLFAEKRLLELDLRGVKINASNSEALQHYAEKPVDDTILIISSNKLDAKTEQTRWYKALDKHGMMILIYSVTAEQLPNWIMQRAKKSQLTLSSTAAAYLAQHVEGNLLAAATEIEKLILLQPKGELTEKTLEEMLVDNTHFDVFNLVDSVLNGNTKRSLHILKNLLAEDIEPTFIIWALAREITTMAEIQREMQQGATLATLFGKFRIWEKRQAGARTFLKRHTVAQCWDLLKYIAKIDRMIKGVEVGNVRDELERLVLNVAGSGIINI